MQPTWPNWILRCQTLTDAFNIVLHYWTEKGFISSNIKKSTSNLEWRAETFIDYVHLFIIIDSFTVSFKKWPSTITGVAFIHYKYMNIYIIPVFCINCLAFFMFDSSSYSIVLHCFMVMLIQHNSTLNHM